MDLALLVVEGSLEDLQSFWTAFNEKEGARTHSEASIRHLHNLAGSHILRGGSTAVLRKEHQDFPPRAALLAVMKVIVSQTVLKSCPILSFRSESCISLFFSFFFLTVPAEVHRDICPGVLLCHSRGLDIFCRGHHGRGRGWTFRKKLSK